MVRVVVSLNSEPMVARCGSGGNADRKFLRFRVELPGESESEPTYPIDG